MPRSKREYCRRCERHTDECGALSKNGNCEDCYTAAVLTQNAEMAAHSGGYFDEWRAKMAASVGAVTDDVSEIGRLHSPPLHGGE